MSRSPGEFYLQNNGPHMRASTTYTCEGDLHAYALVAFQLELLQQALCNLSNAIFAPKKSSVCAFLPFEEVSPPPFCLSQSLWSEFLFHSHSAFPHLLQQPPDPQRSPQVYSPGVGFQQRCPLRSSCLHRITFLRCPFRLRILFALSQASSDFHPPDICRVRSSASSFVGGRASLRPAPDA